MEEVNQHALNTFLKSVEAVNPQHLIKGAIRLNQYNVNEVLICDKRFPVKKNIYMVGFGKAVFDMAITLDTLLCCHLVSGILSIPVGTLDSAEKRQIAEEHTRFKFIEGAEDNLPDEASQNAALQIAEFVQNLTETDLLIVLISGGGSALLPSPKSPITLEEKATAIKLLSNRGANIKELNCVRKRLSDLKGGGLAKMAYPAKVVSLILSDVVGDPLDIIASGPTMPNNDTSNAAMKIIQKYALTKQLPESILNILRSTDEQDESNSSIDSDGNFVHVTNYVIGNNRIAACEACAQARKLGYQARIISLSIGKDVSKISNAYVTIAIEMAKVMKGLSSKENLLECLQKIKAVVSTSDDYIDELISLNLDPGCAVCLVAGGEPTVNVKGRGQGGRNQQLALQFSIDAHNAWAKLPADIKHTELIFLSCGTDGIDGPTDAAGAVGFPQLFAQAKKKALDPLVYVRNNDSYNFYTKFEDGKYLIKTGHTGTNVMDIHILMIKESKPEPKPESNPESKPESTKPETPKTDSAPS